MTKKYDSLKAVRDEVFNLSKSPLYADRVSNNYFPVIGEGNHDSEIMFVGEAPGKNEAKTGRPFCGASGKILDLLFEHIKFSRKDFYITNLVKDRPANNRDPLPLEIELYAPFLDEQIKIIKPKIIVPLGRLSMNYLLKRGNVSEKLDIISKIHGQVFEANFFEKQKVLIVPLYHPAVAVYNRNMLDVLKKDFETLKKLLKNKK